MAINKQKPIQLACDKQVKTMLSSPDFELSLRLYGSRIRFVRVETRNPTASKNPIEFQERIRRASL